MTAVLVLLAAMATAADPPRARHPLGMIRPTEANHQKALRQGLDFQTFARTYKKGLPPKVDLSPMLPPIYPPGQQDQDCVGWSMAYGAKSFLEAVESQRRPADKENHFSPMYIYSQRSNRNASGSERDGMDPLEAIDILEHKGCAPWPMMPYDKNKVNDLPSDGVVLQSYPYQIANHMILPPTTDAIKLMLANNKVVVLGIAVTGAFEDIHGDRPLTTHDRDDIRGYHAICAVGYDDDRRAIRLMNSWGNQWADGGFCWISYDLFKPEGFSDEKRFCNRAYVLVEAPTVEFVPSVRHGGAGDSWSLSVKGSPEALKEVLAVAYLLPDSFSPMLVTKNDADAKFTIDSSEVNPSTSTTLVPVAAYIYTKDFRVERLLVIPCGPEGRTSGGIPSRSTVVVPDLRGTEPKQAEKTLEGLKLRPRTSNFQAEASLSRLGLRPRPGNSLKPLPGSEVPPGKVSRQYPQANTRAPVGGTVILFVGQQPRGGIPSGRTRP